MPVNVISRAFPPPRDRVYVITDFRYGRFWDIPFPVAASNLSPQGRGQRQHKRLPPELMNLPPEGSEKHRRNRKSPRFGFAGFLLGTRDAADFHQALDFKRQGKRGREAGCIKFPSTPPVRVDLPYDIDGECHSRVCCTVKPNPRSAVPWWTLALTKPLPPQKPR